MLDVIESLGTITNLVIASASIAAFVVIPMTWGIVITWLIRGLAGVP